VFVCGFVGLWVCGGFVVGLWLPGGTLSGVNCITEVLNLPHLSTGQAARVWLFSKNVNMSEAFVSPAAHITETKPKTKNMKSKPRQKKALGALSAPFPLLLFYLLILILVIH
jgi:hypothetical protein